MRRRDFTTLALAGTAGTIAAPAIVKAAPATFKWKMTSFYGPNAYFYSEGPGSAKTSANASRTCRMAGSRSSSMAPAS